MSFILDALKKSENARQRASGPALFEVKVASPRNRVPMWTIVIAALLLVNLGVVAWLVMRKPTTNTAHAATPAQSPPVQVAPPAQTAAQTPPPVAPPVQQAPAPAEAAAPPATENETPVAPPAEGNPEDYAPAVEPQTAPTPQGFVRRGTDTGLPTYEEVAANGRAPQLRMDLHVFAPRPQDRFVLINMQRLREGEATRDGVHVDSITNDGAVLSYRGERFVMLRE